MANIRDLKKDINNLCFEVISECSSFQEYSDSTNVENVRELIREAVDLRNDLIFRTNHPPLDDDPKAIKAYFGSIVDDLYEHTITLIEKLNSLSEPSSEFAEKTEPTDSEKTEK
jgi:hypothetical protein